MSEHMNLVKYLVAGVSFNLVWKLGRELFMLTHMLH